MQLRISTKNIVCTITKLCCILYLSITTNGEDFTKEDELYKNFNNVPDAHTSAKSNLLEPFLQRNGSPNIPIYDIRRITANGNEHRLDEIDLREIQRVLKRRKQRNRSRYETRKIFHTIATKIYFCSIFVAKLVIN